MLVTFRTDDTVTGSGFQLSFEQERESCCYANLHHQVYSKYLLLQLLLSSLSLMSRVRLAPTSVDDFCVPFFVNDPVLFSSPQTVYTPQSLSIIPHTLPTPAKSLFTQSQSRSPSSPFSASTVPLPFFPRVQPTLACSSPASF